MARKQSSGVAMKIAGPRQHSLGPGVAERMQKWISRDDRRFIQEVIGMPVHCSVCGCSLALTEDCATTAIAVQALVNPKGRYPSLMARDYLTRLGCKEMTSHTPLIHCACGYTYTAQEVAAMMGRYLMTGQRQFMGRMAQGE